MTERHVSRRDWEASMPYATDVVSVRNISAVVNSGFDIWGREKAQPVSVSVTLSLSSPFATAAASDSLDASTVHYGKLSKNIAAVLEQRGTESEWEPPQWLAARLVLAALATAVDKTVISTLEIDLAFVKGTRFGDSHSLLLSRNPTKSLTSTVLSLQRLRIPCLVGVNSHERSMPQLLVVSVSIDNASSHVTDGYFELEQIVVKTVEESAFETLEALTEEVAARCIKFFIYAKQHPDPSMPHPAGVRVKIEKPSAVMIADAPFIEIYRGCGPLDAYGKKMWAELGNKRPHVPFPLDGRLDEFLKSWKQD